MINKKILQTFNYSQFKKIKGNREINDRHVNALIKSIEEKGLIINPAIVNEKMEIVEGQHRLAACEILNLPFYYYVVQGSGINEVTILNQNRKNWGFTEWMNRYASYNNMEYKIYKSLYEKWGFDHWSTIFLLCRTKGYRSRAGLKDKFYSGTLKIETLEEGKKWAKRIMDVEPYYKNYKRRAFIQAMIRVFHDKSYNHKTFLNRLNMVRDRLYDCSTVGLYLQRIDDIMNYKAPKNKRVNFAMQWGDPESIFAERAA
jgi:hypothetical protein